MTIKVLLLKSGEDVIADVREMLSSDEKHVIGYLLTKPCAVKLTRAPSTEVTTDEDEGMPSTTVQMFPWMPLSKDNIIPVTSDWVVTMVNPQDKIKEMYEKDVLATYGKEQNDSTNSSDESTKTGLTD